MTDQSDFLAFIKGAGFTVKNDYPDRWEGKDMIMVQRSWPGNVFEIQLIADDIVSSFLFDADGEFIEHRNERDE